MGPNPEVTHFLDALDHPLRTEIELLRSIILESDKGIRENIKWNGPNFIFAGTDRITMKIHPPKQIQLVFHRGAKKLEQPKERLIQDRFGLMDWRENDRAIVGFRTQAEITSNRDNLSVLIRAWIKA
ncbi:hypothetical protein GCM10009119_36370 [Algoriphagus jejuensis]|uniref:YdhG-like domain-containing protein n=1 Tax=Algoriphagus jejuensis TaxID=419934 RepID=A0ABN1N431_9BACT